ncbi:hypothetical protein SprV_0702350500 [Sparganum proliferum]
MKINKTDVTASCSLLNDFEPAQFKQYTCTVQFGTIEVIAQKMLGYSPSLAGLDLSSDVFRFYETNVLSSAKINNPYWADDCSRPSLTKLVDLQFHDLGPKVRHLANKHDAGRDDKWATTALANLERIFRRAFLKQDHLKCVK